MASLFCVVVAVALLFAGQVIFARRRGKLLRTWSQAAGELGLGLDQYEEGKWSIRGELDGAVVRAQFRRERQGARRSVQEQVVFYAGVSGRIPAALTVRADSLVRSMSRLAGGEDKEIGDRSFDALVELPRLDANVCAALDGPARERLRTLLAKGGEVREGMIVLEHVWRDYFGSPWLVENLRFLAKLANMLTVTPDALHERLGRNARTDANPPVRLQNLRFLVDAQTQTPAALVASTARALLADESDAVRVLAAKQLGDEGLPTLAAVASARNAETAPRVEALHELRSTRATDLLRLLPSLLADAPAEVTVAALSIVSARGLRSLGEAVVQCAASEHEAVRVAAAHALATVPALLGEQTLIRLLADASIQVRQASVHALGAVAGPAAIEPLSALVSSFTRTELRDAARDAVQRIQLRLVDPKVGHISLAEENELAGAIAVATEARVETGQITLAESNDVNVGERKQFSWLEDPAPPKPRTT